MISFYRDFGVLNFAKLGIGLIPPKPELIVIRDVYVEEFKIDY